jgi:hypothetical protein
MKEVQKERVTAEALCLPLRRDRHKTGDPKRISYFERFAKETSELGVGPVRYHTGQHGRGDSAQL